MGLNPSTIDPDHLQLYGQSGGMLPQSNQEPRAADLLEQALFCCRHGRRELR